MVTKQQGLIMRSEQIHKAKNPEARQPRPLCKVCKSPVLAVKVDRGAKKKPKPRKGRPKRKEPDHERYIHVGYWCLFCERFTYLDGSLSKD